MTREELEMIREQLAECVEQVDVCARCPYDECFDGCMKNPSNCVIAKMCNKYVRELVKTIKEFEPED